MDAARDRWITCDEHVDGPFTADEAVTRLGEIGQLQAAGEAGGCGAAHLIVISKDKPQAGPGRVPGRRPWPRARAAR